MNVFKFGELYMYFLCMPGCGGTLSGPSGSFVSPNFPLAYGHNAECYWNISVARGSRLHLTFLSMDLEQHSRCNYDYVEVGHGSCLSKVITTLKYRSKAMELSWCESKVMSFDCRPKIMELFNVNQN